MSVIDQELMVKAICEIKDNHKHNYAGMCEYQNGNDVLKHYTENFNEFNRQFKLCEDWVNDVALRHPLRRSFNSRTSYGYKHDVEKYARSKGDNDCGECYVCGNTLLIYLVSMGYEYRFYNSTTPNAEFKFSSRIDAKSRFSTIKSK